MKPNSHECVYYGRKLSNIEFDCNHNALGACIGSDRDDEIYDGPDMLSERVKVYINGYPQTYCIDYEIDLEDVLRFAAKYCRGIYDRVASEVESEK